MDLDKLAQELGGKPVSDLDRLASELGGEIASTPGGYGAGEFGKDVGKLVGAGAVRGIAGAPETVQAAGSAAARETLFKPTEVLNLIADPRRLANKLVGSVGLPPVFEETKEKPLVPAEVTAKQRAAVDETLARGKIPQLRQLTEYGNKLSEDIENTISPEMRLAMAESQPTGNIIKALETGDFSEVSMGKNPTALGLTGQAVKVFGTSAPQFIVAMVTKTPTLGAAVGAGQAGAEGIDEARNYIKNMSDEELAKKSEYFRNLVTLGYSTNQARQMTEDKAADTAAMAQGTVGALGGAFTSKLLQGGFDKTLLGNVKSRLGKVLQGAGIAGAEGAITELAEGVATDLSIDKTIVREIGVDSFANLVLGAIGEAAPGVIRGAVAKGEDVKGAEAPEVPPTPGVTPVTPVAVSPTAPPAVIPEGGFETEEEVAAQPTAPVTAVTPEAAPTEAKKPLITPRESVPELAAEAEEIAKQIEEVGQKDFAIGMRGAIKTGKFQKPEDLNFYKERLLQYQQQAGKAKEPVTEEFNIRSFSENYKADKDRFDKFLPNAPQSVQDQVTKSDQYIQALAKKINDAGYKVTDINPTAPKELQDLREKISEIGGSTYRYLLDAQHIARQNKYANPEKLARTEKDLIQDFADADQLLGAAPTPEEMAPKATEVVTEPEVAEPTKAEEPEENRYSYKNVNKPIVDPNEMELKAINIYKKIKAENPDADVDEEIENPNRYHPVEEEPNEKNIKIGDLVYEKGNPEPMIAITVGKDDVKLIDQKEGGGLFYKMDQISKEPIDFDYKFDFGFGPVNVNVSQWLKSDDQWQFDMYGPGASETGYRSALGVRFAGKPGTKAFDKFVEDVVRANAISKPPKPKKLTKEEKIAANKARQAEKKAAAEKAKQPTKAPEQKPADFKIEKSKPVGVIKKPAPEDVFLYKDNPGGSWLKGEIEKNKQYERRESGAPGRFGPNTGSFSSVENVGNKNRNVLIPVSVLSKIKGINNEQENVRAKDLESIKKFMSENNRLPPFQMGRESMDQYLPYLQVDQDGVPYVNEGNHRIMAAKELGFEYLPVEIRYFTGGEQKDGILSPEKVIAYHKKAIADGFTEEKYVSVEKEPKAKTQSEINKERQAEKKAKKEEIPAADMARLERMVELARIANRTGITIERAVDAYNKTTDKQKSIETTEKNLDKEAKDNLFKQASLQYSEQIGRAPKNVNQLLTAVKNGSVSIANTSYEKDFYDVFKIKPKAAPKVEGVATGVAGQINKFMAGNFSDKDVDPEIYKEASIKFLESPLTAKMPSRSDAKIEAKELTDVKPLPIEKKFGKPATSYEDQKKVLLTVAGKKDIRYYLNGIHLNKKKKRMESTDGHRMAIINDANFIGEPKTKSELYVVDKDNKIIEGQYPDVDRVMPKKHADNKATVSVKDLGDYARGIQKAWRYVSSSYNPIIMEIDGKKEGFNSDYIVDMADVFQKLGYSDVNISVDNGKLYATSPDNKVQQVIMGMRDPQSPFVTYEIKGKGKKEPKEVSKKEEVETIKKEVIDNFAKKVKVEEEKTAKRVKAVQEKAIHNKLTESEKKEIAKVFNEPSYNDTAKEKFVEQVILAINKTIADVKDELRQIVERIKAGVLAMAVVFNPATFQTPDFNFPGFVEETKTITAEAPARAEMTDIANKAYSISAPAFIKAKQAFFIADKPNGKIHLFDTDGKFLKSSDALYGKQTGDILSAESRALPIEQTRDIDKVTPAGVYRLSINKEPDYTGGYTLRFNDEKGDLGGIAIHSVYTGNIQEKREARLASKDMKDKKISFGCINVDASFFTGNIIPRIDKMENAGVVVIPDAQDQLNMFVKPVTEKVTAPAKEMKAEDLKKMASRETPYYNDFTSNIDERYFDNQIAKSREEKVTDYAQARAATRRLTKKVAKYGSDIPLQRELNTLLEIEQDLKNYLDMTKPVRNTAQDFMARATKELAEENITPEVEGFIRNVFEKNPAILQGLRLSVRSRAAEGRDVGNFNPYSRLVTLWKDGSGVENPKTIRHELTHSLEQMMLPETKKVLVEQWARALERAMQEHTDAQSKKFFDALNNFLENPSKENFDAATKVMPSYDFYQYMNPSEYWAVNAEAMLGAKLGGAWSRFTNAVKKLLEGLKSFFGMNNKYEIHKAMDKILSGDMNRITKETIADYLFQGKYKIDFLNNVEDIDALLDKHKRPEAPVHPSHPVKDAFMGGYGKSKNIVKKIQEAPLMAASNMVGKADRALTYQRNKNIFYGTGLEQADRERYGGQVRNAHGQAIASVALTNAIHSGHIATQVMTQGKLEFNPKTQMFQAVKDKYSMANVVRAKANLVKKLGDQRAAKVIQAFFEAKRSRSIIDEYLDRTAAYEEAIDSGESVADASRNLKNIEIAMQKINMTDEAIDDFIKLDQKYPELKEMMENWTAVNQNMIDMMEFSGLISKQRAKTLRGIKDYVPWYRIMDDQIDVHSPPSGTRGMTNVSREKKFKSGEVDRDIDDIVDNMIHNVLTLTRNSMRNYAANRIVMEYGTRNEKGKLKVFSQEGADNDGVRFNIVAAGKRIVVQIKDPLVAEAVIGMENIDIPMINALAYLANGLRRSITTFPAFQVVQLFMDAPTAALVTGLKRPDKVWAGVFSSFLKNLRKDDPIVANLRSYGIGGYQSSARTPEKEIQMDIGLIQGSWFSKAMKGLDRFGDASDYAQRRSVYMQTLKETGDELLAIFQANNVIDFQKRGSGQIAQTVTKTVAFMNAYAQSIDVLAKGLAGGGLKGLSRQQAIARMFATGMLLSAATIVYCMAVGDDEEYNKLDDQTKMRNIFIPGLNMRLPMHTGASFFFKAIPELIYNTIMKEGTKDEYDAARLKRALGKSAMDSLLGPNITPTGVKPVVEIVLNKNFFTGGQVTPKGMEDLAAFRQYNQNTSELGKIISALTGTDKTRLLNPMEADHLVRGLLGTAGAAVMWGTNMLIGNRPEPQAKDNPFYGQFIMPDVARGREDLYYDLKTKTDEAYRTHQDLLKKGRKEEAQEWFKENKDLIRVYGYTSSIESNLKEINGEIRRIADQPENKMSSKEKRERINQLQEIKMRTLKDVIAMRKRAGL